MFREHYNHRVWVGKAHVCVRAFAAFTIFKGVKHAVILQRKNITHSMARNVLYSTSPSPGENLQCRGKTSASRQEGSCRECFSKNSLSLSRIFPRVCFGTVELEFKSPQEV